MRGGRGRREGPVLKNRSQGIEKARLAEEESLDFPSFFFDFPSPGLDFPSDGFGNASLISFHDRWNNSTATPEAARDNAPRRRRWRSGAESRRGTADRRASRPGGGNSRPHGTRAQICRAAPLW